MSATEIFSNEDFPIETRLRAAIAVLEQMQQLNAALYRRKTPPEREEMDALRKELARARETIRFEKDRAEAWRETAGRLSAQLDESKAGTLAARLEHERDEWKEHWRASIKRIQVLLEHQGNCELLEYRLDQLTRENEQLRAKLS